MQWPGGTARLLTKRLDTTTSLTLPVAAYS